MTIHLFAHRYQAGDVVGYGRMSEVYRGRDLRMGRDVAIKVLRADLASDPSFQSRFRREAQNAASLNHPSIVGVYDTGEEQGEAGVIPYIVMEFVDGETLRDIWPPAVRWPAAARTGDRRGGLCGAGLLPPARGRAPGRHPGERHGQPRRRGQGDGLRHRPLGEERHGADHRARPPHDDHRHRAVPLARAGPRRHRRHPLRHLRRRLRTVRNTLRHTAFHWSFTGRCCLPTCPGGGPAAERADARLPRDIDALVLKALAKNPQNRYQTADELRKDIARAMTGRPVLATPVMTDEERREFQRAAPVRIEPIGAGPGRGAPGGPNPVARRGSDRDR